MTIWGRGALVMTIEGSMSGGGRGSISTCVGRLDSLVVGAGGSVAMGMRLSPGAIGSG